MKKMLSIVLVGVLVFNGLGVVAFNIDKVQDEEITQLCSNQKINEFIKESVFSDDISWTKLKISDNFNCAGIHTSDLDEDGDIDVLAASAMLNEIAWWRNDGGNPIIWTKQIVSNNFEGAAYCYPIDIDGDGDDDIVGAAWYDNEIAWWRNDGGNPIIWTKQIIKTNYVNAHEVYAYDMDSDGDFDVFGASAGLNEVTWWRNDGGNPINWIEQKIGDCYGARSVYISDVDDDNDNDVLGADFTNNKIILWYNEGGEPIQWTETTINGNFRGAHHVHAYDIDKDGDSDVLGAAYMDNDISWWRNNGGDPIDWNEQIVDDKLNGALRVSVADIDDDGDNDILGSADLSNRISWWRNDGGNPIVWSKKTIDMMCSGAWPLHVSDIDDDGDVDVVGGGTTGISWYENSLYTGSDLECDGSISWSNVKPGSTVTSSFIVKNDGKINSYLNWEIIEFPNWGIWTFFPWSGESLSPEDGSIIVEVEVVAPDEKDKDFDGELKIVNTDANNDYCLISISLSTPRDKSYIDIFFYRLLENYKHVFPLFQLLLGL